MARTSWMIAALAIWPTLTVAGGSSWEVRIVEVSNGVVTLKPVEAGAPWEGCSTAKIHTAFRPEPIGRRTWSKDVVSETTQKEAIAILVAAAKSGTPARFGEMGTGLRRLEDRCSFESHGLALLEGQDGRKQVYSFHGAI